AIMRRRELLTLLGGAAVGWPGTALAQAPARSYRIGLLSATAPVTDEGPFGAPFIRGLAQHGYALGRNVEFERRDAGGPADRLARLLDELAERRIDVLITIGYPTAVAAKAKNMALVADRKSAIPVVAFAAGDPVTTGLVDSLARPGGTITGISDV